MIIFFFSPNVLTGTKKAVFPFSDTPNALNEGFRCDAITDPYWILDHRISLGRLDMLNGEKAVITLKPVRQFSKNVCFFIF